MWSGVKGGQGVKREFRELKIGARRDRQLTL
jgi:hypothetical protein